MKICKTCGKELYDETQICDGCGNIPDVAPQESQTHENKKSKKPLGIISTILIIVIARLVGGFIGDKTATSMGEKNTMDELDTFIEQVTSKYTSGILTDTGYSSPYFGFEFEADENWVMYDKSEVHAASEQSKESALEAGINTMKQENIPDKYIEKWKQTAIFDVEMIASYVKDDVIIGETIIMAYTAYGIDEMTDDEISSMFLNGTGFNNEDMQKIGTVNIAGIPFEYTKATVIVDEDEIVNHILIGEKDNVLCMITNRAFKEYEDDVYDSFLNNIK